jgi:hypothetical protein
MRSLRLAAASTLLALLVPSVPSEARAESPPSPDPYVGAAAPDPAFAFLAGAATNLAGMIVGGTVMATGHGRDPVNNAGWLTMMGGFTLSPVVAHAVEGEWGRGLVFATLPGAMTGATVALFQTVPDTVDHGTLEQQRLMWALFGVGFLGSAAGVVDAALAPRRARARANAASAGHVTVAPIVGSSVVGLQIAGLL